MTDHPDSEPLSRAQQKREAEALQALGETLIRLPGGQLAQIPLPDNLRAAVEAARGIGSRGALRRQRQYIGKLMRDVDARPIHGALARLRQTDAATAAQLHRAEAWRDRLLTEGDAAINGLIETAPHADRQHLRRLVLAARRERTEARPPRHARELFRYIRELLS